MSAPVHTENTEQTAKLFQSEGAQAVRLPDEFHFEGEEVRIRRSGAGVLIEPIKKLPPVKKPPTAEEIDAWFAKLDSYNAGPAIPGGRDQPLMQEREWPR